MSTPCTGVLLPPGAYAAALACLPGVGPAWLVDVLSSRSPDGAWEMVRAGEIGRPARRGAVIKSPAWDDAARHFDVGALWGHCRRHLIDVTWPGAPGYPAALVGGPSPAGVLFTAGRLAAVTDGPLVAVVGTRRCTPEGAAVAYQLGYDLAAGGVGVVSGLALGIDGAAHAGALAAVADGAAGGGRPGTTVGVAASGVDVVYPPQHRALWRQVVRAGAVISETPPGMPAQAWRFPSRNRVIAGLAHMVVVVECHASGGSWHTVDAALRRGTEVGAVPGPVHSSASVGTNTLLHEGATPVRGAADVLDALGLFRDAPSGRRVSAKTASSRPTGPPARDLSSPAAALETRELAPGPGGRRPVAPEAARDGGTSGANPLGTLDGTVLLAVGWQPRCLEDIVERSRLPLGAVVVSLERLEQEGDIVGDAGWWSRRAR